MTRTQAPGSAVQSTERKLAFYRAWLARIIRVAERGTPAAEREASRAIAELVEHLNSDLLCLYRNRESEARRVDEATVLVLALERIRNILRFRSARKRSIQETLRLAIEDYSLPPP